MQGPSDPHDPGPAYVQLSTSLIAYTIADLDAFLDAHPRRKSSLSGVCQQEQCNLQLLNRAEQAGAIRRMAAGGVSDQTIVAATGLSVDVAR
jgi:hypothetical protein